MNAGMKDVRKPYFLIVQGKSVYRKEQDEILNAAN
jgi:hypothetical protein